MTEPLVDATEAVRAAIDKMRRAETYYDYLPTGEANTATSLKQMRETLVEMQCQLTAIINA